MTSYIHTFMDKELAPFTYFKKPLISLQMQPTDPLEKIIINTNILINFVE